MTGPDENAHHTARLTGRVLLAATLAWGAVLGACVGDQPAGPERAAPDRPSLTLNPACAGSGGQTHTDSVLAPETWTRANNPHRVDRRIYIDGAGVLTLQPGVLVCFDASGGGLRATAGGRLVADGLDTARIVLTATDPAWGWDGVQLADTPSAASSLRNVRIEHADFTWALATYDQHAAAIDSVVVRQVEHGVYLWGRGTTFRRSRVDTVTSAANAAVTLGNLITWERNVVRGAAGVGLAVLGTNNISLLGGRIENSGGVGLKVTTTGAGFADTDPVRVTGGAGYPAELAVSALARIYPTLPDQDSLLGNTRDTVVVTGGLLQAWAVAGPALPWRVTSDINVQNSGILIPKPGATLFFAENQGVFAQNGGRVVARGTAAAPVRFTGVNTANGWQGIHLWGTPALGSYLTNVRIENVKLTAAVSAKDAHPVVIDSAVFRQNGAAAFLLSANSRISRTRVDTTLLGYPNAAVSLYQYTTLESTLIRAPAGTGIWMFGAGAQVHSCEVRDGAANGIELDPGHEVHDCNLVNNAGVGIYSSSVVGGNVENNWWGDAAGPNGPSGDGVSAVLDYTPWRTTPFVLPYVP